MKVLMNGNKNGLHIRHSSEDYEDQKTVPEVEATSGACLGLSTFIPT
jgi:hypothetical protein